MLWLHRALSNHKLENVQGYRGKARSWKRDEMMQIMSCELVSVKKWAVSASLNKCMCTSLSEYLSPFGTALVINKSDFDQA